MPRVGFAVMYRWRLHAGREEAFTRAWADVTRAIRAERGGLGSRLHRAEDGTWVAYAQWPDRATWEAAQGAPSAAPADAAATMGEAIAERFTPVLLDPVADLLADQ